MAGQLGRLQCAAITNGCMSSLVFPLGDDNVDIYHLDDAVASDAKVSELLRLNGWHLDHGRWVCGFHQSTAPCEHQDASGRLLPEYASRP